MTQGRGRDVFFPVMGEKLYFRSITLTYATQSDSDIENNIAVLY